MQTAINRIYIFSLLFACLAYSSGAMAADIVEAACEIPLAYDVDVVVVGGSTRGVAAAVAAAEAGATVFLAAPRPYLGEDICATYRLWLLEGEVPTSELGRTIFPPTASSGSDLPFTYKANISSSSKHRDTSKPNTVAKPADKPVEITRVTTPMQAKVALDRALLDAKVEFLYGCSVTDILRDKSGT